MARGYFGQQVISLPRTGSTNDVLKGLAAAGAPEGTVVVADEQMAGRGRFERRWLAPAGTCLLCSILFRPTLALAQVPRLTMLTSMAAADAIQTLAGLEAGLKWPNDLVISTPGGWLKLAGVLTETGVLGDQVSFALVGIGINVNVTPEIMADLAPNATSILAQVGQEIERTALLKVLLAGIEARYARLQAGENPHTEWTARLVTLGRQVQIDAAGDTVQGVAEAVDENGALLLRTADGALHRLLAGDVTLLGTA